jgi:hypothetical protein
MTELLNDVNVITKWRMTELLKDVNGIKLYDVYGIT